MSFSSDVKEELSRQVSRARHCQLAEIAAIISFAGKIRKDGDKVPSVTIYTENVSLARKYFVLIKSAFHVSTQIVIRRNAYLKKSRSYALGIPGPREAERLLNAVKIDWETEKIYENHPVKELLVQNSCCRRGYIRGAFLASGSISDPEKSYHFEIVCGAVEQAEQLVDCIGSFSIEAKIVERKGHFVVYIKEGAQIVDILNVMEAHKALMELENVRILKEVRNSVNRKVNCETANINKTVSAAVKQIEDIKLIKEKVGFDELSPGLKEVAEFRLAYPEITLKELGEMLNPTVGKSGVNHRLRKLMNMAEELRK